MTAVAAPPSFLATFFDQALLKSVIESVLTTSLLLIVLILGFLRGKVLEWIYARVGTYGFQTSVLLPETAVGHSRINDRLTKALNDLLAMRVCVFQFHNGEHFMLSNHAWKVSCSHEVVRPGTPVTLKANSALLISSVSDLVAPLMDPKVQVMGVEQRPACACKEATCPHSKAGLRRVMRYRTEELPGTMAKFLAEEQKIEVLYTIGLVDPRSGCVFGFISVQFDHFTPEDEARVEARICTLCPIAEAVEFFLTDKGARRRVGSRWWWPFG